MSAIGHKMQAESAASTEVSDSKGSQEVKTECHENNEAFFVLGEAHAKEENEEVMIKQELVSDGEMNYSSVSKYMDQMEADFDQVLNSEQRDADVKSVEGSRCAKVHVSLESQTEGNIFSHIGELASVDSSSAEKKKDTDCRDPVQDFMTVQHVKPEAEQAGCSEHLTRISDLPSRSLDSQSNAQKEGTSYSRGKSFVGTKAFSRSNHLTKYKRTQKGEKPYSCSLCAQSFSRSSYLTRHMKTHTGEKPHLCPVCGKSFTQSNDLKKHVRTHSGEKPYSCAICTKSFIRSSELTAHMRTHTGHKPHLCSVCGKSFTESNDLKKHARTHTGEKPYSCSTCTKSFSTSSKLTRHMRTHTGDKPHCCNICSKSFARPSHLTRHKLTHMSNKPHSCSICSKSFPEPSNLAVHMRSHTGSKPYKCSICDKSFAQASTLTRHKRTHK